MTQIQNSEEKINRRFWKFGHLNFGIVSDFDIRISNFLFSKDGFYNPF